jgi:hypothetical protein
MLTGLKRRASALICNSKLARDCEIRMEFAVFSGSSTTEWYIRTTARGLERRAAVRKTPQRTIELFTQCLLDRSTTISGALC